MPRLQRQRGQVMPYVAVLVIILAAAAFYVFDMGRIINARIQAQNATDAAALAAVAMKINKHHVDTILRAAMSQEALISQAEIRAAQAVALRAVLRSQNTPPTIIDPNNPGVPIPNPNLKIKDLGDLYILHANQAYKHAVKLHRERLALEAYYAWLVKVGPEAVREAARIGYLANMQGYDTPNDPKYQRNVEETLDSLLDLEENQGFGEVGGIPYGENAASLNGRFGKSFIEISTELSPEQYGAALLNYLDQYKALNTNAAARLEKTGQTKTAPQSMLEMNWYSPQLMRIENKPGQVGH